MKQTSQIKQKLRQLHIIIIYLNQLSALFLKVFVRLYFLFYIISPTQPLPRAEKNPNKQK